MDEQKDEKKIVKFECEMLSQHGSFAGLKKEARTSLIQKWRKLDTTSMQAVQFRYFQETNFVGTYRVNQRGSISLKLHGGSQRSRRLSAAEIETLSSIPPVANPDWPEDEQPCDPSNLEHVETHESSVLNGIEDKFGGGKNFYIIPPVVLLARLQLSN
jgi:hypothetical protein